MCCHWVLIFQILLSLKLLIPPKRCPQSRRKKHLVTGSTSELGFLDSVGFCDVFSVTHHDSRKVLEQLNALLMKTSCSCRGPECCTIILGHSFGIFHGLFQFLYL